MNFPVAALPAVLRLALPVVATLLCAASVPTGDAPVRPRIGPASLVVGQWVGGRFVGWASCAEPDEAVLCVHFILDARLRRVRTLSGPRIPRQLGIRTVTTFRPGRGAAVVLLVQPGTRAPAAWQGVIVVQERAEEACVPAEQLDGFRIPPPRGSRRVDGLLCTPI